MYLNTFKDKSGKLMGVIIVSIMQTLHLLLIYIIIANLFHLDRKLLKEYHFMIYLVVTIVLILNNYRYNYIKTYESMHNDWLFEINLANNNKGWLLVLYIFLNFSLTLTLGILIN
jgi:hypothetical protein